MKNIIVVGGSKGIGYALLQSNITHSKVFNISRTAPELVHDNLVHLQCDVTQDPLPHIEEPIDALIYCPGSINLKPITRLSTEDFEQDYQINVIGAVKCIKQYLPNLKQSSQPAVVFFSTVATKLGMPFHSSVAASKAAVEGLTKSLAAELAPHIRVNAIAPTVTNTPLAAKLLRNEKTTEMLKERHPLKMILDPDEVAQTVNFLITTKSRSMSGQVLEMDCGIVNLKL